MQLQDSAAVVTGAASGLGAATAAALAEKGATVFAFDLPASIDQATPRPGIELIPVDVTNADQVREGIDRACRSGLPLRVAVNCAGIGPSMRILGKKGVHDPAFFAKVVTVNLLGSFNVLSLAAERIAESPADEHGQRGIVINTASIAAFEGQVGQVAYAASKGGVVGMTLPAARDLAQYGIRVNTIAPGIVDTAMLQTVSPEFRASLAAGIPFPQRLAAPEEFADLAVFLAEHDYINGETVRMDGALRMAPR
jgi:NAD(P)-dependent dehydrogenase (short-subunit alcohol dehydrogenase family)